MPRTWAVIKREFTEAVRTKTFVLGTVFGPVFMVGIMILPILIGGGDGGERGVAIVDATDFGVGGAVAAALPTLEQAIVDGAEDRRYYRTEVIVLDGRDPDAVREPLAARVADGALNGYLWLPTDVVDGGTALYEGENASSFGEMAEIEAAVEHAVRHHRFRESDIDAAQVAAALRPVPFEARKTGENTATGSAGATFFLAYILGFAIYMVVILYGQAVMRGVLEEKRDRIVEIMASSIRITQLMVGKVIGIGATGMLQVTIWVVFAAIVLTEGGGLAADLGFDLPELPHVPLRVGIAFLTFFLGGFFLYSVIFAVVGAIATSDQEAQQMNFPAMTPIIAGLFMMFPALEAPDGTVAVVGSLVPFTSPIVMPARVTLTEVPTPELLGSAALLVGTAALLLWIAAKIYRIGMLATGKKPSFKELVRWVRAA